MGSCDLKELSVGRPSLDLEKTSAAVDGSGTFESRVLVIREERRRDAEKCQGARVLVVREERRRDAEKWQGTRLSSEA